MVGSVVDFAKVRVSHAAVIGRRLPRLRFTAEGIELLTCGCPVGGQAAVDY